MFESISMRLIAICRHQSKKVIPNIFLTGLFFSHFLCFFLAHAQTIQVNNKCYKLELAGSIIDVKSCKTTQILIKHLDCKTLKANKSDKTMGQLSQCSMNSANGSVTVDNKKVFFSAKLRNTPGFEVWDIRSTSNTSVADASSQMKNIAKSVSVDGDDEAEDEVSSEFIASNLDVEAEWILGISPNKRNVVQSTAPAGGYYGRSTSAVNDAQVFQNQVAFSYLSATTTHQIDNKVNAEFSLMAGQKVPYWLSTPFGITKQNTLEIGSAYLEYDIKAYQSMVVGVWNFESLNSFDSTFVSSSSYDTLIHPHQFSGAMWYYKDDTQVGGLFLVNGWNEQVDINNSFSFGVTHSKYWSPKFRTDLFIYSGDEGSKGVGTETHYLNHAEFKISSDDKYDLGLIWGKWGSDYYYNDVFFEFNYFRVEDDKYAFRIESFTNENSFLLQNGWKKFTNLSVAYRKKISLNSILKLEVNYANATQVIDDLPPEKDRNRFNIYSSVVVKF